jgi:hypothetical protein
MRLNYFVRDQPPPHLGRYIYVPDDYSIHFDESHLCEEDSQEPYGSLAVGTLELSISMQNGMLRFVSGYCPSRSWVASELKTPECLFGAVFVEDYKTMMPGVTYPVETIRSPVVRFDSRSGWLCIGDDYRVGDVVAVQYSDDSIVLFEHSDAKSIWMRLRNAPALEQAG